MTLPEIDHAELAREIAQHLGHQGVPVGSRPFALPIPAVASAGQVLAASVVLFGWSLINTAGVAAACTFLDGNDATGQPLANVLLPPGSSQTIWLGPQGILARIGLWHSSDAGVSGAVWAVHATGSR